MLTFIAIIHVAIAIFLVLLVLIQDSKGAMGGLLGGGGSQSVFGASGATNILVKITRYTAIIFAATCLLLSWYSANQTGGSVMDKYKAANVGDSPAATPDVQSEKSLPPDPEPEL